jgi:hypothetical protein
MGKRASVVTLAVVIGSLGLSGCGSSSADPVKNLDSGATLACLTWNPGRTFTDGTDYLKTTSPITILSVKALGASNATIDDAVIVPLKGSQNAIGTGWGLPTAAKNEAADLAPKAWAKRRSLPAQMTPVGEWELVYGIRVRHRGEARVNGATVTVDTHGHRSTFHSELLLEILPPKAATTACKAR